ncbi:MAG: single-stranded-DNA-specific exonuclease RecJ [Opitutales bacterium]
MRWKDKRIDEALASHLSENLSLTPFLARILAGNGMSDRLEIERFLQPRLADLADPFDMPGMGPAVDRIILAIDRGEEILILGDYDVDGITATSLLYGVLSGLAASPRFVIPRREGEGYGLSHAVLQRAMGESKPDLLITLDCGTNSTDEIAFLSEQNVDVVIVDHHQLKGVLSTQAIFVNPHLNDDHGEAWRHLSAVGLAFKVSHGLLKRLRERGDVRAVEFPIKEQLDLVALGTVADLVPLRGENRIFAHSGLRQLSDSARPGIHELREVSGLRPGTDLTATDIAFKLAPRINAGGRLAAADIPVNLMICDNLLESRALAQQLDKLNQERQQIEKSITEEAEEQVKRNEADGLGIIAHGDHWHHGVVGIVAGKLSRSHGKPVIVLGGDGGSLKGSGRGVQGLDLVAILSLCSDWLEAWGGHPAAVGLSLDRKNLDNFRKAFAAAVEKICNGQLPEPTLEITCWMEQQSLGNDLLRELDKLQPFGQENPEPILGLRNVHLAQAPQVVGKNHFRFKVSTGDGLVSGIAWNLANRKPPADQPIDLAIRLGWNHWNGVISPQMTLVDWRLTQ